MKTCDRVREKSNTTQQGRRESQRSADVIAATDMLPGAVERRRRGSSRNCSRESHASFPFDARRSVCVRRSTRRPVRMTRISGAGRRSPRASTPLHPYATAIVALSPKGGAARIHRRGVDHLSAAATSIGNSIFVRVPRPRSLSMSNEPPRRSARSRMP